MRPRRACGGGGLPVAPRPAEVSVMKRYAYVCLTGVGLACMLCAAVVTAT